MNNLKERWFNFLGIALGPGTIIFVLLTVGSLLLAYFFKENTLFSTLLSVVSSILAGIAGNFVKDDYDKLIGKNILEKKGLSAIRNLKSIERQLNNIRLWIEGFAKEKITKEQKRILSEIDRHISTTQLNIQSGFSDWVDMVPELAEEAGRIAEITKKQQEVFRAYVEELLNKKKELVVSKDEKRVEELKGRISTLEKQIKDIRSDNTRFNSAIGGSVLLPTAAGNMPLTFGLSELEWPHSTTLFGTSGKEKCRCVKCCECL
ncbi:MAG: hypothetical protein NTZ42_03995 [Candidatus Gribaldobacteria bacterium]|nr:hypothetical protein [Candidatus Gribaldobacteria bacterium]